MTEMQLALLYGSQKNPGTNIINYHESYHPEDLPILKRAWKALVEAEPIFSTRFTITDGRGYLTENVTPSFC